LFYGFDAAEARQVNGLEFRIIGCIYLWKNFEMNMVQRVSLFFLTPNLSPIGEGSSSAWGLRVYFEVSKTF
jgi:hypothetical protein